MSYSYGTEEYYKKFIDLQEKLRKSEEERLKLEMKFNEMMQVTREEEQMHYRNLRARYKRFLEEDKRRQERNEGILRTLERIGSRASMLEAKTERFKLLRRQYQAFLRRMYSHASKEQSKEISSELKKKLLTKEFPREEHVIKTDLLNRYLKNAESDVIEDAGRVYRSSAKLNERLPFTLTSGNTTGFKEKLTGDGNGVFAEYLPNSANIAADEVLSSIRSRNLTKKDDELSIDDESIEKCKFSNEFWKPKQKQLQKDLDSNPDFVLGDIPYNISIVKDTNEEIVQSNKTTELIKEIVNSENGSNQNQMPILIDDHEQASLKENILTAMQVDTSKIKENETMEQQINPPVSLDGYKQNQNDKFELNEEINLNEKYGEIYKDVNKDDQENMKTIPTDTNTSKDINERLLAQQDNNEQDVQQYSTSNQKQFDEKVQSVECTNQDPSLQQDGVNGQPAQQHVSSKQEQQNNGNGLALHYDQTEQVQYDAHGYPSHYDENGQLVQYSANDHLLQQYNASGQMMPQFDENGQLTQKYEESGQAIEQYDENGQLIQQYDNNGQLIQQYDENGQLVQQYDENGQLIQQYDENGQLIQQYDENGELIQQYDENGQLIQQYDENRQFIQQYDENGQLIQQYDENGQLIQQYDENGQLIQQYDENGQLIQQYDENGQLIQQYDENGQLIQQYDANGHIIQQYDENGELIQQYNDSGQLIQQYDKCGQLIQQYDTNGQLIQEYDETRQPIQKNDNDTQQLNQFYEQEICDNSGQVKHQVDGQEQSYNQDDDASGLQCNKVEQKHAQFDENGQVLQHDDSQLAQSFVREDQYHEGSQASQNIDANNILSGDKHEISETNEVKEIEQIHEQHSENSEEVHLINVGDKLQIQELQSKLEITMENKPKVIDMLDTDTESTKQDTKISNDSDFDYSNG